MMDMHIGNRFYIRAARAENFKNPFDGKFGVIKYVHHSYIIATLDEGIHVWVPASDIEEVRNDSHSTIPKDNVLNNQSE